ADQPDLAAQPAAGATPAVVPAEPGAFHEVRKYPLMMLVGIAVIVVAGATTATIALVNGGLPAVALIPLFITLSALFFVIWLGGRSTEVTIAEGVLNLRLGDMRHTFDLQGDGTVIEIGGSPEDGDWTMTIVRRGLSPVQIDDAAVDPVAFMAALAHWRPDVLQVGSDD
ncbi:MAG: hypothetical protein KKA97_03565, partial [Actinobacteria bacterium]|nr:hypothetical protein [Actinomycetota bacterium]